MSTRRVKDAKDLSTNELIYFKGHAQATYMSDGSTVEDAINSKGNGTITGVSINGTAIATSGNVSLPVASGSNYGVTRLSSSTSSTNTTLAATPSAVKAAYDLANSKQEKLTSGTNIKTVNGESILGAGNISTTQVYVTDFTLNNLRASSSEQGYYPCDAAAVCAALDAGKIILVPLYEGATGYVVANVYYEDLLYWAVYDDLYPGVFTFDMGVTQTDIDSTAISLKKFVDASKYSYLDDVISEGGEYVGTNNDLLPSIKLDNLIAVEATNGNVVSGLYGGRSSEFNDNGALDDTHGTLAFFAGASDINDVANAPTKIYQDGTIDTSKLSATGGNVGEFNIDANQYLCASTSTNENVISHLGLSMVSRNSSGNQEKYVSINGNSSSASITIANARATTSNNTALSVQASGSTGTGLANSYGNNTAILVNYGDIAHSNGVFRGFRPKVRIVTSSTTLTNYDTIICTNNTSGVITLTLPSSPVDSQMYVIRRLQSDKQQNSDVKVYGNGAKIITTHLAEAVSTTNIIEYNNAMVLHYIGVIDGTKYWIANFMTYM